MIWVTGPLDACPVTAELCTGFVCTTDITLPRLEIWGGRGGQGGSETPRIPQRDPQDPPKAPPKRDPQIPTFEGF